MVKMAIFNSIANVQGRTLLDLCCGTGGLGIEALLRGARKVVFVDIERNRILRLKKHLSDIGLIEYSVLVNKDVVSYIKKSTECFDFIIADPPYQTDLAVRILKQVSTTDILKTSGTLIIEHYKRLKLPENEGKIFLIKLKTYGDTLVSYYGII